MGTEHHIEEDTCERCGLCAQVCPNGGIALTYGFLAAHPLGLGATPVSLIPPAVERVPELRRLFRIPDENEVTAAMVAGYPRIRFRRGIRRELAGVTYIS